MNYIRLHTNCTEFGIYCILINVSYYYNHLCNIVNKCLVCQFGNLQFQENNFLKRQPPSLLYHAILGCFWYIVSIEI